MTPQRTSTSAIELHRLLALSRDLLQTADFGSALAYIGPAIRDLLASDGAFLLMSMGGHDHGVEFDRNGAAHPARKESFLYQYARQAMDKASMFLLAAAEPGGVAAQAGNLSAGGIASMLAVTFPQVNPLGVLLVFWHKKKREPFLARRVALMQQLTELICASAGSLDSRGGLERQVSAQTDEIAEITEEHVQEMQRRDRVEAEMYRISTTDVMTGLKNRRGFFLQAEQSFKVAQRRRLISAVIFADVDGLKAVNDTLGHAVGDQLIRDSARIFQAAFRASDVVARFGGDEFVAFTLDASQPEAILARIQENIDAFNQHASRPYQVAVSTGIVQCDPASALSLADHLLMADKQMYAQKTQQHHFMPSRPVPSPTDLPRH
ncbi:GGDEF domain-containing protein [Noviherbaspirillum sedimenti]|uniref:diguanylate cyclase n=1 Tax=Noviherbaspirillum sedimenti TaxID=2320865 RepID=A0A3A3G6S8_9BURK|nr:GGDEF domain-containing protein [Noviherbaspirillum sedimenti]RJG03534.1 GGDEF domain-containing protein [Noviherbaspirillum sedimenti]